MDAAKGRITNRSAVRGLSSPCLAALTGLLLVSATGAAALDRVSVRSDGTQGNAGSTGPAVSDFGDCIAFSSNASNLLPNRQDNNNVSDVFVYNRITQSLQRVSVSTDGAQGNRASQAQGFRPGIDAGCTCVAFSSDANNLVAEDTNGATDVFLRDLGDQTTERISVGVGGQASGPSSFPSVTGDCGRIAFQSTASNLVDGDTNNTSDIFVFDRGGGAVTRVSVGGGGEQADGASITPSISRDGQCVAFASAATNLLAGDSNGTTDIYVACGGVVTCRASVDSNGAEANGPSFLPSLSEDGNLVAFKSLASNLVAGDRNTAADVFVHNCQSGETERVSIGNVGQEGNDHSFPGTISSDGRFVAFGSFASNLILGVGTRSQAQIYVRDRGQGTTVIVSRNLAGNPGNGSAPDLPPSISTDGNFTAFASFASDLVPGDTNEAMDAFVTGLTCEDDDDCPPGSMCNENGECEPPATATPTPTPACTGDEDCPPGQICVTPPGVCMEATPTPTPTEGACMDDEDCPPGQVCIEETGNCVTPRPTCTSDDDCSIECTDPSECPAPNVPPENLCAPEQSCEGGFCSPAERCRSMRCVPPRCCEDQSQCFGVEACLLGVCECGGDCNLDGVIFGTEISTMINVLAGVAPLSVCRAGDIDGDSQIMGNEIGLALSNLAQGCPDLLTPLSGGGQSRAADVVTFGIGSAAGTPGQTVTVGITASGGGGEMVMAQIDLLFDPAQLSVGDPASACQLDSRMTRQILRASLPETPETSDGRKRLRVFVGDVVLPTTPFDDGPVASCTFQINGDANGGTVTVEGDHMNVSDTNGGAFGTAATGAGIEIVVSSSGDGEDNSGSEDAAGPAAGAAQAACVADCNGDGTVVIAEVVAAVRDALRGESGSCRAADANGNGSTSIDEVMIGLGNLASGCPGR